MFEDGTVLPAALPPSANKHAQTIISKLNSNDFCTDTSDPGETHLDSHANMVVLGKECYQISDVEKYAEVLGWSPLCGVVDEVPIIDAIVSYIVPNSNKFYLLLICNALYVPDMEHNLIPPQIMRKAGLEVNELQKRQG